MKVRCDLGQQLPWQVCPQWHPKDLARCSENQGQFCACPCGKVSFGQEIGCFDSVDSQQVTFNVDSNGILEVTAEVPFRSFVGISLSMSSGGHEDSPQGRDSDHK